MNYPKVSIVTPSLNQGQFIEEAIQSVLSQDYPNIEYIVIDGGSTDGTLDILKKYDKDIIWISEPDEGQADAINKGWRMASGDILTWLNADDILFPAAIDYVFKFLTEKQEYSAAYGDHTYIDEKGLSLINIRKIPFDFNIMVYGINFICPAIFVKRRVIDEIGYLDTHFDCVFDLEFYLRVAKAGFKLGYIPRALFGFRWHGRSKSANLGSKFRKEARMIRDQYRNRKIQIKVLDKLHFNLLRRFYRLKYQVKKVLLGQMPDFMTLRTVKRHLRRIE